MTGLIVWSVFCIGLGLVVVAALDDKSTVERCLVGAGFACVVWAAGIAVWMAVGVIL